MLFNCSSGPGEQMQAKNKFTSKVDITTFVHDFAAKKCTCFYLSF